MYEEQGQEAVRRIQGVLALAKKHGPAVVEEACEVALESGASNYYRFVSRYLERGPQLLLSADEYKDHRMTAWKTIQGDLKKAGANVVDQEVVVDRNLVTSRQPSDIPAFIRESLKVLEQIPAQR